MLRKHGVVGKFVEFYGEGIASVPLANRATIGNMGPEFGSTCGIFPIDNVTLDYLRLTGRSEEQVALVEAYAKANKLWGDASDPDYVEPQYSEYEELDLGTVVPSIAGPKRPQDRIKLSESKRNSSKPCPRTKRTRPCRSRLPFPPTSAVTSTSPTVMWRSHPSPRAQTHPIRP